jgi:hypothetical protein
MALRDPSTKQRGEPRTHMGDSVNAFEVCPVLPRT